MIGQVFLVRGSGFEQAVTWEMGVKTYGQFGMCTARILGEGAASSSLSVLTHMQD